MDMEMRDLVAKDYDEALRRAAQITADPEGVQLGLVSIVLDEPIAATGARMLEDTLFQAAHLHVLSQTDPMPLPEEDDETWRWPLSPSVQGMSAITLQKNVAMLATLSDFKGGYLKRRDLIIKRTDPRLDAGFIDALPLDVFLAMVCVIEGMPLRGAIFL